jgi:recombination protein RecT
MAEENRLVVRTEKELKVFMQKNYLVQIKNFFGDEKQALKFLSSMFSAIEKTPELMRCEMSTVINSFMTMAQLGLMPSNVSGEAYVLPYAGKAQFQLGYQGLVTLFFRAGGTNIRAEIVRKNDKFSLKNGVIDHEIDVMKSNAERGEPVAAYAIAVVNGTEISKAMNAKDIMEIGRNFSKSFKSDFSPWNVKNDPELWMWKKTVLKQLGKMMPKNETIYKAIAADNEDSRLAKAEGLVEESGLRMGDFTDKKKHGKENKATTGEEAEGSRAAGGAQE